MTAKKENCFPRGQIDTYLNSKGIEKLVEIPFDPNVGKSSESGIPVAESHPSSETAQNFSILADKIIDHLERPSS